MDVVINSESTLVPTGSQVMLNQGHFYQHLLACLGYPLEAPPVADLLRRYHGLSGEWLVVSPIHWVATHNDAMIDASGETLQLTEKDSRAFFAALTEFVAQDNMKTHYHDAHHWLIQSEHHPTIHAKPVNMLSHHSLMPEIQSLDTTFFWQRFITENQMFFSQHGLNRERIDSCQINGVWVWGSGALNTSQDREIIADELMLPWAAYLSTQVRRYEVPLQYSHPNAVLLFNEMNPTTLSKLEHQLKRNTTCWYWNNETYVTKPKYWLTRLWRRFYYAD